MRVNRLGRMRRGLVPEGLDESRSPVRSAGELMEKGASVAPVTIETLGFRSTQLREPKQRSIVPSERVAYKNFPQHFVLGFRRVPPLG